MKILVYGTLRATFPNHYLLEGADFVKYAETTPEFTMISLGGFPGILRGGNTSIKGEVYEVDEPTLKTLDKLERSPDWYKRELVLLDDGSWVEAYIYPPLRVKEVGMFVVVESGDWSKR